MRLRHTSIRARMILLVLVPLLALIGIYAYAVVGQAGTAVGLAHAGKISGTTITPVATAVVALNAGRSGGVGSRVPRPGPARAPFQQDEAATDRQFRVLATITRSGPVTSNATPLEKAAAARFVNDDKAA